MNYLIKHLKIALALVKISWKNSIEYMNDFVVIFLDFFVTTVSTIIFWKYLLVDYNRLGDWSMTGLVLIGIFGNASWAISEVLAGAWMLPEKITEGKLDKYLCRPVNTLFALLLEDMQLEELIKGVLSLIVLLIWHSVTFSVSVNSINLFLAVSSLILGVLIVAGIRALYASVSFWLPNTEGIEFLIHMEDLGIDRYPLDIFHGSIRVILLSIIPVGFVACFPAMFYLGLFKNPSSFFLLEVLALIIVYSILSVLWKKGICRYEATGG